MEKIILKSNSRDEAGKQNRTLRDGGWVPAVVYGHGIEPKAIKIEKRLLESVYADAGGNKIVQLSIDDSGVKNALIHDIQHDPVKGDIIHADIYLVRMDEKIRTEIPVHFIGESTAVYQQEGTLVRNVETIEVEALPGNLPESIEVDISILDDFEKTIHISDLKVPADVEILDDPEELVAKVDPPRSEEELAELEAEVVEELPPEEGEEAAGEGEGETEPAEPGEAKEE